MYNALKAETRKLLTVRSTYYYMAAIIGLVLFIGGWVTGYRIEKPLLLDPGYLNEQILNAMSAMSLLIALAMLLILGNEYRFNLIIYTLTSAKSRTKVLVAKILVATAFVAVMTAIIIGLTIVSTLVGIHLHHGYHLVTQHVFYRDVIWRSLYIAWGFTMLAMILIALLRNQIGAIVLFLIIPSTVETILSALLKNNAQYLPFRAIGSVVDTHPAYVGATVGKSAVIGLVYIVVGWLVAWYLFLRRDAN